MCGTTSMGTLYPGIHIALTTHAGSRGHTRWFNTLILNCISCPVAHGPLARVFFCLTGRRPGCGLNWHLPRPKLRKPQCFSGHGGAWLWTQAFSLTAHVTVSVLVVGGQPWALQPRAAVKAATTLKCLCPDLSRSRWSDAFWVGLLSISCCCLSLPSDTSDWQSA